jgi:putative oxidoreductase
VVQIEAESGRRWNYWASGFARWLMGGIFIISGLAKINDPVNFLLTIREFRLLPGGVEIILALFLPWLEFILGLSLAFGLLYKTSAWMIACLNGFFALALVSILVRGIEIDCGCFGLMADILHLPDRADWRAVLRNLVFTGIALFVARSESSIFSLENYLRKSFSK